MKEAVWVTGLGIVSPLGLGVPEFWESCMAGRSAARVLKADWVAGLSTKIAADIEEFDPIAAGLEKAHARNLDRTSQFAVAATMEALRDAGLTLSRSETRKRALQVDGVDPVRLGSIVGSGIGGLSAFEAAHGAWHQSRDKDKVKRYALPMLIPNAPAGQVALHVGAQAECKAISTACAAGTMAIGDAFRILGRGEADVMIAGGADGVAGDDDGFGLMGFERLKTLSTRNEDPQAASRPFDRDRDGFVLGEGAGFLILERESHARARGVRPYAVVSGYAANCDAHSMMQLDESGNSIHRLIDSALRDAEMIPADIDAVSAHGTSTIVNDRTESTAIRKTFGSRTGEVAVTGLKSMTGHAIAASGPMEAAAAVLAYREGFLAPTINYDTPDPECDIAVIANAPLRKTPQGTLKLSYGFGGHNAALIFAPPP